MVRAAAAALAASIADPMPVSWDAAVTTVSGAVTTNDIPPPSAA
ncbi:hypothetical protein OSJ17_12465 [Mycobacterium ulcerans]